MAMYDRQIKTAKRLIAKYGIDSPVTSKEVVTPNPNRPWETTTVETTNNAPICFLPADAKTIEMMGLTEVPVNAMLGYMGAVDFKVDLTSTILFDGKTWAIKALDILKPNGRTILYTMVLGA